MSESRNVVRRSNNPDVSDRISVAVLRLGINPVRESGGVETTQ
tara:strand:+ start:403 stop:531 length:129 start_codon:yes stop_codon:yes gene_type:complete